MLIFHPCSGDTVCCQLGDELCLASSPNASARIDAKIVLSTGIENQLVRLHNVTHPSIQRLAQKGVASATNPIGPDVVIRVGR
jgi:hypothetical protein